MGRPYEALIGAHKQRAFAVNRMHSIRLPRLTLPIGSRIPRRFGVSVTGCEMIFAYDHDNGQTAGRTAREASCHTTLYWSARMQALRLTHASRIPLSLSAWMTPARSGRGRVRAADIAVEIASGERLAALQADWQALVARADCAQRLHESAAGEARRRRRSGPPPRGAARLARTRRQAHASSASGPFRIGRGAAIDPAGERPGGTRHGAWLPGNAGDRPRRARRRAGGDAGSHRQRRQPAQDRRPRRHDRGRRHHAGAAPGAGRARQRALRAGRSGPPAARLRPRRQAIPGKGALQRQPQEAAPAPAPARRKRRARIHGCDGRPRTSNARSKTSWRSRPPAGKAAKARRWPATRRTRLTRAP